MLRGGPAAARFARALPVETAPKVEIAQHRVRHGVLQIAHIKKTHIK
jgi:hypothetical protein